ncbi:hypothetical protein GCM10012287_17760 [Streptomyces daqingensis]|uniref:Uncharacterized protein n=1 Tax=Streptomyces daqingensis TaxID=1472640 RepID=A0ABQ2M3I9_9ACTN|nr:hypothetical protein GCM10012287_17760 [Streptomyces daqingensis]
MRVPGSVPGVPGRGSRGSVVQDHVALAEIELCGELMIAASAAEAAGEERLSVARIDEVLGTVPGDVDETAWRSVQRPVARSTQARGQASGGRAAASPHRRS